MSTKLLLCLMKFCTLGLTCSPAAQTLAKYYPVRCHFVDKPKKS
ncbi:hypothetical protein GLYMA_13G101950v4 [Glycine max]|nr:hypothetical protein GLYMA_13G101950v4 [Glycine max]KAH1100727.1 hypothetical protein GYH30_035731 [Glycine max]